jgi:peptide chain release factor 1
MLSLVRLSPVWITFNYRYERFSHNKGWTFEVVNIAESDLKGYKVQYLNYILIDTKVILRANEYRIHHFSHTSIYISFQEASAAISGADVYGKLKFESGIHRVQVSFLPVQ